MATMERPLQRITVAEYSMDPGWTYTGEQIERIWACLNEKRERRLEHRARWVDAINEHARCFVGRMEWEETRPKTAHVRAEISGLHNAIEEFAGCCANLSQDTWASLDDWGVHHEGRPITPNLREAWKRLEWLSSVTGIAADTPAKKGQLPKEARRKFVVSLGRLWAEAHNGEWPQRSHDPKTVTDFGPFHEFVASCFESFPPYARGLEDVIREVCEMGK